MFRAMIFRLIAVLALADGDTSTDAACDSPTCQPVAPAPISALQVHKNPRPIEIPPSEPPSGLAVTAGEWRDRVELAALARALYLYGFGSDLAAQLRGGDN